MAQRNVQGEQINASIDDLSDVTISSPQANNLLVKTSSGWVNRPSPTLINFYGATLKLTSVFNSEQSTGSTQDVPVLDHFKIIPFNNQVVSNGAWYNSSFLGRLTVPTGIVRARFVAHVRFNDVNIDNNTKLFMMLYENGDPVLNVTGYNYIADRGGIGITPNGLPAFRGNNLTLNTGWIPVTVGSFYEVRVTHFDYSPNIPIQDAWFSVEGST